MKKKIVIFILVLNMLGLSGCKAFFPSEEDKQARIESVAATQTQRVLEERATQTAKPTQGPSIFDSATKTPTPTEGPTPTMTPVFTIGNLTLRESEETWVDVGDRPGDKARQIGELARGSTWPVVQSYSLQHYWQLLVVGYVEPLDYDSDKGETRCEYHSWGHFEEKSLCHAHLLNKNGKLVGQIQGGQEVELLETVEKDGRVTAYKIQFYVWIPESAKNFEAKGE